MCVCICVSVSLVRIAAFCR